MNIKRKRKESGFADTKRIPHENHPAHYRKIGNDKIEYVTTTHHNPAKIKNKTIKTEPLHRNFNPTDTEPAYIVPIVYEGKRSALGEEKHNYRISNADKPTINKIFETAPREKISKTSNSKKMAKKKKR